ncbi:hypothetical protein EJ377_20395 [Chryseobacterium arthrosphaerae]|uniref:Uncharacterized protein n=1 Tax=Chryseobacterium arthrosphaerae TaxID=651561 RepID=A0A432DTX6_9FLAO|nr:hypothetical protein EJ377_20395 [Chryseobacterium arthrosphaerae]
MKVLQQVISTARERGSVRLRRNASKCRTSDHQFRKSSHGSVSLKIVREPVYGTQSEPIIGGFYNLQDQLSSTGFSVSFDISISQLNGSDFGFQAVNSISEQCIARVDFEKTGVLKILNTISGAQNMVSTSGNWSSNNWYRFKAVGTAAGISYYLNGILIYTGLQYLS